MDIPPEQSLDGAPSQALGGTLVGWFWHAGAIPTSGTMY
jgi:hypothetical protein